MTAIITCGETRASLAAARALGRAHIPVAVGAKKRPSLAMWSRFATSTFLTEDDTADAQVFATQIAEEQEGRYACCVLTSTDAAYWAMSRFRELLPNAGKRILPPHYSVVRSLDHEALHFFAESLGISCSPLVRIPESAAPSLVHGLIKKLSFPLLVRPIVMWPEREDGTTRTNKPTVLHKEEQLLAMLHASDNLGMLVSAYNTKKSISYFGVADRGHVLVEGFQERQNELLPYNEVATLWQTINPILSIRRSSEILLDALQWQGPFKIEFVRDYRGHHRLISLIGRLWGSLQLAIHANVNIPLICYRMAQGTLTKSSLHNATPNIRLRWLLGDVMAKITNPWQTAKEAARSLKPKDLWQSFKIREVKTYYDVVDIDDPMPFLFELQNKAWKQSFIERFKRHLAPKA